MTAKRIKLSGITFLAFFMGYVFKGLYIDYIEIPDHKSRASRLSTQRPTSISMSDPSISNPTFFPLRIFDAEPAEVDIPDLQSLARDIESDRELLDIIVAYYQENKSKLESRWKETNQDRLKALLAMYMSHISHPYGSAQDPGTFVKYVRNTRASFCTLYSKYQSRILESFGLKWRYVAVSSGFHGWIEAKIGSRWEIFDATSNVWIDRSAFELLGGTRRSYRLFYTPWADINRQDAREVIAGRKEPLYGTPGVLRSNMPGLGIYFLTKKYRQNTGVQIEVWKDFSPPSS